jgi:hypothetical protein
MEPSQEQSKPTVLGSLINALVSVAVAYCIATLIGINRFAHAWIQDPWYREYEVVLLVLLVIELGSVAVFQKGLVKRWWLLIVCGFLAGWVNGSVAVIASIILHRQMVRIEHLGRVPGGWALLMLLPLPLMSWLLGGIAGAIMIVLSRTSVHLPRIKQ